MSLLTPHQRHYDKASPEQKRTARELYPEFYQMRVELLEKNIRLLERIAKLKVLGAQNRKDVLLQYAIASGYIPADPLENILHPERSEAQQSEERRKARYQRGLLNPRARGRDNATVKRRDIDGQEKDVSERYFNASTLQARDPTKIAGRPDQAGEPGGGGFYANYRDLLTTLKSGIVQYPREAAAGGGIANNNNN